MDSIKWYKDGNEFYRIVPNTPIERDRVVIFDRPGVRLDRQKSGVSTRLCSVVAKLSEFSSLNVYSLPH